MQKKFVPVDPDVHAAAHQSKFLTGQTLQGFVTSAIWRHLDYIEEQAEASKKPGTGAFKSAKAIRCDVAD